METTLHRFEFSIKVILWALAALFPLWLVPYLPLEFGRELTFNILIIGGFLIFLLTILMRGEIRYRHSPIMYGVVILLLVTGLSTILSKAAPLSFFLGDPSSEKYTTLLIGTMLLLLGASAFRTNEEAERVLIVLIISGSLAGLVTAIQLLSGLQIFSYLSSTARGIDFNVVGTINSFALFISALLVMALGLLFSPYFSKLKSWIQYLIYSSIIIFLLDLLVINYRSSWFVLLGVGIFLFGFVLKAVRAEGGRFDLRSLLIVLLLVFTLVMISIRTPLIRTNIPAEISPSFITTLKIGVGTMKEDLKSLFLGVGPANFGLQWNLYKDPAINQTVFWNVRFNQGFSWAATLLTTTGLLGLLAFVVLILTSCFVFLRSLIFSKEEQGDVSISFFLGFVALVIAAFLYPANLTFVLLLFLSLGILSFLLGRKKYSQLNFVSTETPESVASVQSHHVGSSLLKNFWDVVEYRIQFDAPWVVFVSSLVVIFILALSVAALYFEVGQVQAALVRQKGIESINSGDFDKAVSRFEQAALLDGNNYRNYQLMVQAQMSKAQGIIQKASKGENVQQEFQSVITAAIQNSQRAIDLNPQESLVWRTQGGLYELIIPYIQGAEGLAAGAYKRSAQLDPVNPTAWVDVARPGLVFADRALLAMNQTQDQKQKEQINQARVNALGEVNKALEKAVEVKPDFALGHFLLAQTALRLGNIKTAIDSVEKAKLAAPLDIGIAFQLGLLYYQTGDLNRAGSEFLRAVSINENYSNARYFLGLIYDRLGDKQKAIAEFQRVAGLNPDNQEVKRILENLTNGKNALEKIVPPAEAPEKRKETPIRDDQSKSKR